MTVESTIQERESITQCNNEKLRTLLDEKQLIPIQELLVVLKKADSDYSRYQDNRYNDNFWDNLKKEFRKNNPLNYKDTIKILFDSKKKEEREAQSIIYAREKEEVIKDNLSNSIQKKELYELLEDVYSIDGIKKMISIYENEKKDILSLLNFLSKSVNEKAKEGEKSAQAYVKLGSTDQILRRILQEEFPQGSESTIVYNQSIDKKINDIKILVKNHIGDEYYKDITTDLNYGSVKVKYLCPVAKEFVLIEVDIQKMERIYRFLQTEIEKLDGK